MNGEQVQGDSVLASQPLATAVSFKFPVFWTNDPSLWLNQGKALFSLRNITSQRAMSLDVGTYLSSEEAAQVRDVLMSPRRIVRTIS